MKRLFSIIFSVAISFCVILPLASYSSITSYADEYDSFYDGEIYRYVVEIWNELVNGVSTPLKDTNEKLNEVDDVKKSVDELKDELTVDVTKREAVDQISNIPNLITNLNNELWQGVKNFFANTSPSMDSKISFALIKPDDSKYNNIVNELTIFAYSIVLVFFAANIIEQSVKYEIFTMKGMLMIFGRLLLAKIIIDCSVTICMGILRAIENLTGKIVGSDSLMFESPTINLPTSNIKIIGPIIDTVIATVVSLSVLALIGTIFVLFVIVLIKLVLRSFELTILVSTSPVFFGCLSSDITKQYFKNFIVTFIQVAAQTLFMAIALFIGTKYLTSTPFDSGEIQSFEKLFDWYIASFPRSIIMIAMCIMMIKPPKVLTNLLK